MGNLIVGAIILVILSISIGKIISEKKKGVNCIGCPHGCQSDKAVTTITIK